MTNGEKYKSSEERYKTFIECLKGNEGVLEAVDIAFSWLDLEAEQEKTLPCPFCRGETIVRKNWNDTYQVACISTGCWYCSKCETIDAHAIAAHNRVARAVMAAKEKEAKGEADASLVAAAPEMAKVCYDLIMWDGCRDASICDIVAEAKAAYTKASGEEAK